jgi:hypothetical protein
MKGRFDQVPVGSTPHSGTHDHDIAEAQSTSEHFLVIREILCQPLFNGVVHIKGVLTSKTNQGEETSVYDCSPEAYTDILIHVQHWNNGRGSLYGFLLAYCWPKGLGRILGNVPSEKLGNKVAHFPRRKLPLYHVMTEPAA